MSESLRFVVPMPPNVTNRSRGSTHWRRAYSEKKDYWELLCMALACSGGFTYKPRPGAGFTLIMPPVPRRAFERVRMSSVMYLGAAMDDDNALARHKPLIDWLKATRYLVDDRKKNIVWEGLPEQVVKRDGNYRIELVITPL